MFTIYMVYVKSVLYKLANELAVQESLNSITLGNMYNVSHT